MAQRTFGQLISDTIREVRGQATALEAQQAVADALGIIDSKGNWEFLIQKSLINVEAPFNVGTVAVNAGDTAVTLTPDVSGLKWQMSWRYKSIKFASRQIAYDITTFPSQVTATLASPLSGSTSITTDAYNIYQMRYALPSDCEPGRDLKIKGPFGLGEDGTGEIKKLGNLTFERKRQDYGVSPGGPFWYTDGAYDETNQVATIQFWPWPTVAGEYRLTYYKKLTLPTSMTSVVPIPQAFERLPILMAASQIMLKSRTQGWLEKKQFADVMLRDLYSRYAASPAYDNSIEPFDEDGTLPSYAANNSMFTYE